MDEREYNIEKLLMLQQKVVVFRTELPNIYKDLLKKQGKISTENLVKHAKINVQIKSINNSKQELLDTLKMDKVGIKQKVTMNDILRQAEDIQKCYDVIRY